MRFIKNALRLLKRLSDKYLGNFAETLYWRLRPGAWSRFLLTPVNINHPHRKFIINEIKSRYCFQSLLELGCGPGTNLINLTKEFPGNKFVGLDINKAALRIGRKYAIENKLDNIHLRRGNLLRKLPFQDKEFDITLTDAALINVTPDNIYHVIDEIFRVTGTAVVISELSDLTAEFCAYRDHWMYNWNAVLKKYPYKKRVMKYPDGIFKKQWATYGYLVVIEC
jgi:ubiquinone/menaquinone biosynthesis C-methylase UbiE